VWTTIRQWPAGRGEAGAAAGELEDLGYGAVWIGGGRDESLHAALLAATTRLVVATGIVEVWTNSAPEVAAWYHQLERDSGGRFLLGFGAGHAERANPASGQTYTKPLSRRATSHRRQRLLECTRADAPRVERLSQHGGPSASAQPSGTSGRVVAAAVSARLG
jgi:alkanesulfonate monooxygenase SsuD/methylene tetrahydromethanopterin reductase-like flavin-dependent oxidoreductase (luciferase family)